MTTTPVAPVGPRFVAVTVKVTVVPTAGDGVVDGLGHADVGRRLTVHLGRRRVVARIGIGLVLSP